MKRKTLSLIAGAALLFATAVPAASMPVWAAKGGAVRMAAPKSAPMAPAKTTPNGSGTNSQSTLNQNAKTQQQARPNDSPNAVPREYGAVLIPLGQCHAQYWPVGRRHVFGQYAEQSLWLGQHGLDGRYPRRAV